MIDFKTLLFPQRCPVCDRPVKPAGALVCRSCAPKLVYVRQPLCMKCGKELSDENQEYCRDCLHKNICMTEESACTGIRVLKGGLPVQICGQAGIRRFFRKRDGMAFGAADPFLEGRRIGPCSAASGAEAQKEATIRRSFWHWKSENS